jgi:predicted double-glycine peptidase
MAIYPRFGSVPVMLIAWIIAVMLMPFSGQAVGGTINIPDLGSGSINVHVKSLKERKYNLIARQQLDFSCGSAAVSTLLTYQYHDPVKEETIFKAMWENGDQAKIRREGFSLLDIKQFLEARNYSADGYVSSLDKLASVGIPAIVLIRDNGYNHFVVIKGLKDGMVAFGDPALGERVMPQTQFEKMLYNRIIFVINGHQDKVVFNNPADWKIREKSPLDMARGSDDMSNMMLMRPPIGSF